MNPTNTKQTKYIHRPTNKYYYTNGASGLVSEDNDSPIPLWLAENSQDWEVIDISKRFYIFDNISKQYYDGLDIHNNPKFTQGIQDVKLMTIEKAGETIIKLNKQINRVELSINIW